MGLFNSIRLGSSAAGDYEIERSLRFNDNDTAYLSRNFGTGGNRKKWTFSAWIKRANLGGSAGEMRIFGGSTNASHIFFTTNDALTWDVAAPGSSASANLTTSQLFRDPSAWYHIVCALDTDESTADNRMRMYINGSEITSFGTRTNPSSGYAANAINADAFADGDRSLHTIGYRTSVQGSAGMEFDGYMAEINFIDGQQYDPSYFGATDVLTGQWNPKKYGGGYGTTGFYLSLIDNSGTTATTLGKDSSGNSNNFTPNNFSVAAGVGNDSLEDTPTNNFPTFNPIDTSSGTISNGNLDLTTATGSSTNYGNWAIPKTGKWYMESTMVDNGPHYSPIIVATNYLGLSDTTYTDSNLSYYINGQKKFNGSWSAYGDTFTQNDVIGVAVDVDNNQVTFYKNGSSQGTLSFTFASGVDYFFAASDGSSYGGSATSWNFGQRPFIHTVPTGFEKLCTANLPDPTIKLPDDHFNTILWTGNGTNGRTVTGVGFDPDLTWIKCRSDAVDHLWYDTIRGGNKVLLGNTNDLESSSSQYGYLSAFATDGFTLTQGTNGTHPMGSVNHSGRTYVAWNWKGGGSASSNSDGSITSSVSANTTAGFSVLTYTGTGSQTTVGHGLGVKPKVIITKLRDTNTQDWFFYPKQLTGNADTYIKFNTDNTVASDAHTYPNVEPTSTVYTVGGDDGGDGTNGNGKAYVAYCWSEVAGYSKFGKYDGNGSSDGRFVHTGFKVTWLLIKRITSAEHWILADTKRNSNVGRESPADSYLLASANNAESTGIVYDMLSNGFKFRSTSQNTSGHTYLYMAFAESPFKYSRAR